MSQTQKLTFPPYFLWGTATAAFQIEGATSADGRGPSIWDTFCRTPGKVLNGDTGDPACDHYHRYQQDVDILAELGVKAYRFSIAWPRVIPQGRGEVNEKGLDFYDRLVDALLAKDIQPFATLYHWDLPQPLQDDGGWPARGIIDAFANYADVVTRRLGDRVHHWMTINEPWCVSFLSHLIGDHAPGWHDLHLAIQAAHHTLVAHGRAVQAIRANGHSRTRAGIVLNFSWADPATDSAEDRAAAQRWDSFFNRWFADPLYCGAYPTDMLEIVGPNAPVIHQGDMETIAAPTDFLGVNYYSRAVVSHSADAPLLNLRIERPEGEYTDMDWEIYPPAFYSLLTALWRDYHIPALYVTENGAAFADEVSADGQVHDPRRIAFLQSYIAAAHRAMSEGVPLRGYFVWSLMDNFEWSYGYSKRFGIVHVDYATQKRTLKDSARWYSQVTRDNGFSV